MALSLNPAINDLQLGQLLQKCITKNTFSACDDLSQGRSVISMAKISTILLNAIDYCVDAQKLQQFLLKYFNFKSSNQLCNWKRILGALQKSAAPPKRTQLSEFLPLEMKPYAAQIAQECKKWDLNMMGEIEVKKLKKIVSKKCQLELNDAEFVEFCKSYNASFSNNDKMISYGDFFKKLGFTLGKQNKLELGSSSGSLRDSLELRKIERKFRGLIIKKYDELHRAIQAADRFQEGYIPIDQMQAFLSEIVMPEMADTSLFKQILSMCGIKATGRIDWFRFLAKFKQTQVGINKSSTNNLQRGLTIPINSSKRNYPIHTIQRVNTEQEVMDTFWKYLLANFDCSRVAYLHMDMNNNGLLETHELKEFFDIKFPNLRTNERVIKNVLTRFDPTHTGRITFDRFREMFEIREDISAHKWLWDKHHVNTIIENRLPWATLLDVLRDQIARNLAHLTDEFQLHQNKVSKTELKSILNNNINCLNLTLEETNRLWLLFEQNKDETSTPTISMMSFVKGLNLENHCKPINLNGVGESIINRSINRELNRKQAQMNTLNNQAKIATKIMTNNMTADDVLSMLGENMNKHSASAREVFIKYSKKIPTTGKPLMISVNTFLRTLKSYNIYILSKTVEESVLKLVGFEFNESSNPGSSNSPDSISYTNLIRNLEQHQLKKIHSKEDSIANLNNHQTVRERYWQNSSGRSRFQCVSDPEILAKIIKYKIPLNFGTCHEAFTKFANKQSQIMSYKDLEKLVASLMLQPENASVLKECCDILGLSKKGVGYEEFLNVFEMHYTEEDIKPYITSVHRYNKIDDARDPKNLPSVTAFYQKFVDTMNIKYSEASKCRQDLIGNMNIADQTNMAKTDFRKMIQTHFNLAKNDPEWSEIWGTLCRKAGISETSKSMAVDTLFNILGKDAFSPSDEGMSKEMVQLNSEENQHHLDCQERKRDVLVGNQDCLTQVLHLDDIAQILREKIKANFGTLRTAYDTLASSNSSYCVTIKNFQTYLKTTLSIRLADEQMFEFFKLLGGDSKSMSLSEILNKKLSYEQFSKLLDECRLDKAVNVKKLDSSQSVSGKKEPVTFDSKVKAVVTSKFNELVLIFNQTQSGEDGITQEEVHRVLMLYGVSSEDAKKAVAKYTNWKSFMEKYDHFKRGIEDVEDKTNKMNGIADVKKSEEKIVKIVEKGEESEKIEKPEKGNSEKLLKKNPTLSLTNNLKGLSGIRPSSAASTIFSQRSLTLSQISSVNTGLTSIPENKLSKNKLFPKANNNHKSIKLHSLILNNWKEISRVLQTSTTTSSSLESSNVVNTASAVDQALTYDNFIGIFNQYILKNHDQTNIEPRDTLQILYESSDVERIIPCLVLSGILLNRPMSKIMLVNKLWTNQLEQVGTKSKVRLLANPRFCNALIYLRKELRSKSHSSSLKQILHQCRAQDPNRSFKIASDKFQEILSGIVSKNLESEHMFYIILFYDRELTGNIPYLQFYNDFK